MYWTKKKIAEVQQKMKKAATNSKATKAEKEAFAEKMMSADIGKKIYWTDE
jgi:hypothetical protein